MKRILSVIFLICFITSGAVIAGNYGYEFYDGIFLPGPVETYLKLRDDGKDRRGLGIGLGENTTTHAGTTRTQINWITGELETVGTNTLRFDVDGALFEGASENILLQSRTFTAAAGWTPTGVTTAKNKTGVDGVANSATTVTDFDTDIFADTVFRSISKSASDSTTYFTASIFIKKTTGATTFPALGLIFTGGTSKYAYFCLETDGGTATAVSFNTAANIGFTIESAGSFWRLSVWGTDNGTNTSIVFDFYPAFNADASNTEDTSVTGSAIIDAAQLELTAYPTSYIDNDGVAIGSDLVTDGGFAAVTLGGEMITNGDNEAAAASWDNDFANNSTYAQSADRGYLSANSAKITATGAAVPFYSYNDTGGTNYSIGKTYTISGRFYLVDAGNDITGVEILGYDASGFLSGITYTTKDAWTAFEYTMQARSSGDQLFYRFGGLNSSAGNSFYLDNISLKESSFTNWTAGVGWGPGTDGVGVLTGKANKVAGTASNLTQNILTSGITYQLKAVETRTTGTVRLSASSSHGTYYGVNGTVYEYLTSNGTTLTIRGDAAFAGTIDDVTGKSHGLARPTEAGATVWAISTDLVAVLADQGAVVLTWTPGFNEADETIDGGILSVLDQVNSLVYYDVSDHGFASYDGTTEAKVAKAFVLGTEYKIAVRWPSSTGKYEIGVKDAGAWSWGAEVNFDGSFNPGASMIVGHSIRTAFHIKDVIFYRRPLTQALIEKRH